MTHRLVARLIILAVGRFEMPLTADAPPRATHARIAVLGLTSAPPASALPPQEAAFRHGLRELGWVEGQTLTIEWRWAEGSLERFATLVDEVVRPPVAVMVVPNQLTAKVAQQATTTIPIIIAGGGALAQSAPTLAQPGGNVTGFASLGPELAPKRLELLTHAVPGLTRVAVLRGHAPQTRELQAMEVGARALGVFGDGGSFYPRRAHLAELALTHRLPSIFSTRAFAAAGGLMSYGSSPRDNMTLGDKVFFNFNCVVLDVAPVRIGSGLLIGPAVQIDAATHPLSAAERRTGLEYGKPVEIGAGSVVTRDVPAGVFAAGNPCHIVREIGA